MMMVFFDATIKKDDLSFGDGVRGMDRIALVAFYVLGGDLPRGDLRMKGRHIVIVIDVTPRAQGGDQIEFVYLSPSHHRSRCVSLVVVSSAKATIAKRRTRCFLSKTKKKRRTSTDHRF